MLESNFKMIKEYNFKSSLDMGRLGVMLAKIKLAEKYGEITDFNSDKVMQKRGIDLLIPALGYVEVKTDSHSPDKYYFEVEDNGHPGAIYNCTADYYVVFFYKYDVIHIIKRAELVYWVTKHYSWIKHSNPGWVCHLTSVNGRNKWCSEGLIIPNNIFTKDVSVGILAWNETKGVI